MKFKYLILISILLNQNIAFSISEKNKCLLFSASKSATAIGLYYYGMSIEANNDKEYFYKLKIMTGLVFALCFLEIASMFNEPDSHLNNQSEQDDDSPHVQHNNTMNITNYIHNRNEESYESGIAQGRIEGFLLGYVARHSQQIM